MKQEYQMTDEEFERIKAIAQRPATPVMKVGDAITGSDKLDDANQFWKDLGEKYGFVWDSVEGAGGADPKIFRATPSTF